MSRKPCYQNQSQCTKVKRFACASTEESKKWFPTWPALKGQKVIPHLDPPGRQKSEHASKFSGAHLQNGFASILVDHISKMVSHRFF